VQVTWRVLSCLAVLPGWMSRDLVVRVPEPPDPLRALAKGAAGAGLPARACRGVAA
jgi:hypothetical protein